MHIISTIKKWILLGVLLWAGLSLKPVIAQDAEKITQKFLRSLGNRWKLRKLNSVFLKLEVTINDLQFEAHVYHKADNMYKQVLFFNGDTVQVQIFNNDRAYISNYKQSEMLSVNQKEAFRHQAWLYPELAFAENNYTLEYEGVEVLNRVKAHKIRVTSPREYTFFMWYRKRTGMRIRTKYPVGEQGREAYQIYDILRYKELDGIAFPVYKRIITGNALIEMELVGVRFSDLKAERFKIPD